MCCIGADAEAEVFNQNTLKIRGEILRGHQQIDNDYSQQNSTDYENDIITGMKILLDSQTVPQHIIFLVKSLENSRV